MKLVRICRIECDREDCEERRAAHSGTRHTTPAVLHYIYSPREGTLATSTCENPKSKLIETNWHLNDNESRNGKGNGERNTQNSDGINMTVFANRFN